jgi:hypothetical protein
VSESVTVSKSDHCGCQVTETPHTPPPYLVPNCRHTQNCFPTLRGCSLLPVTFFLPLFSFNCHLWLATSSKKASQTTTALQWSPPFCIGYTHQPIQFLIVLDPFWHSFVTVMEFHTAQTISKNQIHHDPTT